ncbi:hypothetical protein JCM1840_004948 [Sporobolomyces johnsonii]
MLSTPSRSPAFDPSQGSATPANSAKQSAEVVARTLSPSRLSSSKSSRSPPSLIHSFTRDLRPLDAEDNPFSLDNTRDSDQSGSGSGSDDDDSDDSDGFGGSKTAAPTKVDDDEAELSKGLAEAKLAPSVPAAAATGSKGLEERKVVKTAEEIAQARQAKKAVKKPEDGSKPANLNKGAPVVMSRREREEKQKAEAKERYQKLHAAGKTDEARADLARLAAIRKQREAAKAAKEKDAASKEAEQKAALAKSGRKIAK